ncbi:MAG: AAA family ATPase [Candidatus Caldarchaeum sp.]
MTRGKLNAQYEELGGSMKIPIRRGSLTLVASSDIARVEQIASQGAGEFKHVYIVDFGTSTVKRLVRGDWQVVKIKVHEETPEGVKQQKKVKISPRIFLKRVGELENSLFVLWVPSPEISSKPPTVPHSSSLVFITPFISDVPPTWMPYFDEYVDATMADDLDMAEVFGKVIPELRGLTYGELKALASKNLSGEALFAEADRMRLKRFAAVGIKPEKLPKQDEIAIDSYLLRYVAKHARNGVSILLVGASGAGKTYLARAIAAMLNQPCYSLSAGLMLEAKKNALPDLFASLTYGEHASIILNEFDRLVDASNMIKTMFLTYLEKRPQGWFCGTAVDLFKLLEIGEDGRGRGSVELVRPGRIDEIIPVPPPFESDTKLKLVKIIARERGISLDERAAKEIAFFDTFIYPADYIALLERYRIDGVKGLEYHEIPDRRADFEKMLDTLESVGFTSHVLLDEIRRRMYTGWL